MSIDTQNRSILRHLRSGRKLTALDALRRFDCLRLSGRILELRQAGYAIATRMVRLRNGKRVAEYSLTA